MSYSPSYGFWKFFQAQKRINNPKPNVSGKPDAIPKHPLTSREMLDSMNRYPKYNEYGNPLSVISISNCMDSSWCVQISTGVSSIGAIVSQHYNFDVAVENAYLQWLNLPNR